jgi:hypothetical protein
VDPAVEECVETLRAMDQATSISNFRQCAESMATDKEELQWIRQRLHIPTLLIRKGEAVDETLFLDQLQLELDSMRA